MQCYAMDMLCYAMSKYVVVIVILLRITFSGNIVLCAMYRKYVLGTISTSSYNFFILRLSLSLSAPLPWLTSTAPTDEVGSADDGSSLQGRYVAIGQARAPSLRRCCSS